MRIGRWLAAAAVVGAVLAIDSPLAQGAGQGEPPSAQTLTGSFRITPGSCQNGKPEGSYLAVTFGTRAVRNPSSSCGGGTYTLLSPTGSGLESGHYTSAARSVFDRHPLQLATSSLSYEAPPRFYLVNGKVNADVRSVVASYHGGSYPIGDERATGTYQRSSGRMSLQWFSGESFTSASAGTEVHLAGRFVGAVRPVAMGTTVQLGTVSFDAGKPQRAVDAASTDARGGSRHSTANGHHAGRRGHGRGHRVRNAADQTSTGNPKLFLLAELLVVANILAFYGLGRRKRGQK